MKKLFFFTVMLSSCIHLFAQDFVIPANYKLETKEDYTVYEKDIIAAANWLQATPFTQEIEKRKMVSAFVLKWVNGSPTVNVELNETIFNFEKKNEGMLILFMAASSRYVLENNYSKDMRAKHRSALKALIEVYKSGKGISKDKKMDKLVKADEEGKLDQWLEENLKIAVH